MVDAQPSRISLKFTSSGSRRMSTMIRRVNIAVAESENSEGSEEVSIKDHDDNGDAEEENEEPSAQSFQLMRDLYPHEEQFFDELHDDDFINYIENLYQEQRHMVLENRVFENFLMANEPSLLQGLPQARQAIEELEGISPLMPPGLEYPNMEPVVPTPKTAMFSDKGNRINLSQRTDLVLRDVEEMQLNLNDFTEKAHKTKFRLRAEIEESSIRGDEIRDARELFEQGTVIDAVDPITQRIPAEKFTWYMAEWLKSARLVTEKLRLRNSSLKIQYTKLKNLLIQKIELGESISEVDFEQLHIENKHLLERIEQMNTHLVQLKIITGKANLNLATHKNYLQKILNGLKTLKLAIDETAALTQEHERECVIAEKEVQEAKEKHDEVKNLIENFKVPEVLDYIKVKARLHELKKTLKVLCRKENIIKIIISSLTKHMLTLTNSSKPESSWFKKRDSMDYSASEYYEFDEDDEEEVKTLFVSRIEPEFDIFKVLKKPGEYSD